MPGVERGFHGVCRNDQFLSSNLLRSLVPFFDDEAVLLLHFPDSFIQQAQILVEPNIQRIFNVFVGN